MFFEGDDHTLATSTSVHTGQSWTRIIGTPEQKDGYGLFKGDSQEVAEFDAGTVDGIFEGDVSFADSSYTGDPRRSVFRLRWTDGNNAIYLYQDLSTSELVLRELIGGTGTDIGSAEIVFTEENWYNVRAEMSGKFIKIYVNDELLISAIADHTVSSGGSYSDPSDPDNTALNYDLTNTGETIGVQMPVVTGNGTEEIHYDNLLFERFDNRFQTTSYEYDQLGRLTKTVMPDPDGQGDLEAPSMTYEYDLMGRVTKTTDALGNTVHTEYDHLGRVTETGSGALTETWTYDDNGRVETHIDTAGRTTSNSYNAAGVLDETTFMSDQETSYVYDHLGRVIEVHLADPDDGGSLTRPTISYEYDAAGNRTKSIDPLGHETTYEYDALNRLTKTIDAESATSTTEYDALGRTTKTTDAAGTTAQYAHDLLGRLTSTTDGAGNITTHSYDDLGRRVQTLQPATTVTGVLTTGTIDYEYDYAGNMLSLTDPNGNTTSWTYDGLNRQTAEVNELNKTRTFEYDKEGHLTKRVDRNGRVREFSYQFAYGTNDNYRITSEEWFADVNDTTADHSIGWTYTSEGWVNVVSDANSTIDYDYDSLGRITQIDFSGTASYPDVRIRHSWDDLNRRTNMIMDVHDGTSWIADQWSKMTYDAAGRVTQILHRDADGANGEDVQNKRIDFTYTDINRWDKITRYENTNGSLDELVAQTRYGYDSGHRLTSMTHDDAALSGSTGDDIAVYTWGWDTASRIDSFTATNKTEADESTDYNYDATNQLTEEDFITPIPGQTDNNWEYDANGNRTNTGYSTGTNNRLLSDGTYNYTYDNEGNRTRKTTIATGEYVEYSFDHRNRLTGAKFYDSSDVLQSEVIYTYDAMDRLIQREHDSTPGGAIEETEAYVFDAAGKRDGVTTVPLDDIIAVFDETGSLTTRYLHGPGIDQILAEETLNTDGTVDEVTWALGDHQGTVRDLVTFDHSDGSTDIDTHRKYDAFGNITVGSKDFRYAFTGRYYDTDINQQWHSRRWYDTLTAKWTSEDPIGFAAGDVNLARYVGNVATSRADPSGQQEAQGGYPWDGSDTTWDGRDTSWDYMPLPPPDAATQYGSINNLSLPPKSLPSWAAGVAWESFPQQIQAMLHAGHYRMAEELWAEKRRPQDGPGEMILWVEAVDALTKKREENIRLFQRQLGMSMSLGIARYPIELCVGGDLVTGQELTALDHILGIISLAPIAAPAARSIGAASRSGRIAKIVDVGTPGSHWVRNAPNSASVSRGVQLRQRFGTQFDEYMHFRGQGFTPAQSKYLTQPYGSRAGHHFPIPQRTGRDWNIPSSIIDCRFNVLRPRGISIGRFYELHYRVDPFFHGSRFPKAIGGTWRGSQLGLNRYSGIQKIWYSTPGPTKVGAGVGIGTGAGAGYWWFSGDSE